MKIVVCIKQVPDTDTIRWSKENNIIREGMLSIVNPYDEFAIEAALDIKKDCQCNVHITAVSMGPPQACEVLEHALAKGCDYGILLSDKKFAGADTIATSKTLAQCVKNKISDFDLIICGQFAIDGDTAQTGPSIAEHLGISQVTFVKEIININEHARKALVKQEHEWGYNIVEISLPCVLCMTRNEEKSLYEPKIGDYIKASKGPVDTFSAADIELPEELTGMRGSPTFVNKAFKPEINRAPEIVECDNCGKTLLDKIFEVYNK